MTSIDITADLEKLVTLKGTAESILKHPNFEHHITHRDDSWFVDDEELARKLGSFVVEVGWAVAAKQNPPQPAPRRSTSGRCDQCDQMSHGLTLAVDMSGIDGMVCRSCLRGDALSFG